ncbi:alpha-L-rhamnosidase [Chitinophaga silvatica]|uniref:Alpha-L-rhamnosidase n=1 Tax=Chitinophaga silvatica TaxID=2282649 RepID=A0A3E1Y2K1_9BACT|nr:alpha-L-rhamnosidase C-terminal domain-containing protein [Chitinophaga silvatica]RFS18908.1 alpha-L-rhamnosidase [Chitinophaga silvatica]
MKVRNIIPVAALVFSTALANAQQLPPVFDNSRLATLETTPTVRKYLSPVKIVWQSSKEGANIHNAERFLTKGNGQADLANKNMCVLTSTSSVRPGILFDFGTEIHGGLQLVTGMSKVNKPIKLRVRFGESVSEAMSDIEPEKNATNDHAMRDMIVEVPWLGKLEIGNTGFRFVRIDLVDADVQLQLKEVRAIFVYRDIPYQGSFNSSDPLLNKIWLTGAYTVHLNMQDYLWDGIKRDRLVWIGDMHPETSTISAVFGNNEVVPKSLDLSRDITPLPGYMNGMVSYSMWWVLIQRDWFMHTGDMKYLKEQGVYLKGLLAHFISKIDPVTNSEKLDDGTRFLDWPSSENKPAIHAGLQAMMVMTLKAGADLSRRLNDLETAKNCDEAIAKLKKYVPAINGSKQAAALIALADMVPAEKINNEVLSVGGVKDFSTFYGYYMLQAKAKAGDYQGSINDIRTYWGAMLDLGATTFWEDFNMDWLPNASRIDEMVKPGQKDIHGDYGAYCYKGFRHSLCHGWASGPTAWLTEHVLGVSVVEPGCKVLKIVPHMGDLSFVEGTFPTPYGIVKIKHTKTADGKIVSDIKAPAQVKVLRK